MSLNKHETSFFRDGHPFVLLCSEILPALAARHTGPLNLWCAACSTGQEPYTIAVAISERQPAIAQRLNILATDMRVEQRSLEDVFLDVTGKEVRP